MSSNVNSDLRSRIVKKLRELHLIEERINPLDYPQTLSVMKPGEMGDVIAKLTSYGLREINIPIAAFTSWEPRLGFTWGYFGHGPYRFAYNILMHFTSGDEKFAKDFAYEFVVDFVQPLPDRGGTIKAPEIIRWIDEARGRKPKTFKEIESKSRDINRKYCTA